MKKRILAITTVRSDYDLMVPLYKLLQADSSIDMRLLVAGAHMSHTYGHTVDIISSDGFEILAKLETLLDANSSQSRVKSASILFQNAIDIIVQYQPHLIIYAGDREDVIILAIIAGYLGIPSIHFYGGDHAKDGYIDNPIRHATSKLSTIHMVTMQQHKERLLLMGESEERIHVIGNMSLDNIVSHVPTSMNHLKNMFNIRKIFDVSALVIFHPFSEEINDCHAYFENILLSLKSKNIFGFISYPNSDPGNRSIIDIIKKYENDNHFFIYKNMDRNTYLSIYKNCQFIIGNSSSGILEASSIPIPAINVGLRQTGRFSPRNVIFCNTDISSISESIDKALSSAFQQSIQSIRNPYGDGKSAIKAFNIIKSDDFLRLLPKKEDPIDINGC